MHPNGSPRQNAAHPRTSTSLGPSTLYRLGEQALKFAKPVVFTLGVGGVVVWDFRYWVEFVGFSSHEAIVGDASQIWEEAPGTTSKGGGPCERGELVGVGYEREVEDVLRGLPNR